MFVTDLKSSQKVDYSNVSQSTGSGRQNALSVIPECRDEEEEAGTVVVDICVDWGSPVGQRSKRGW